MRQIFNDPVIENTFRKQGFVIVPFMDPSQANELKAKIKTLNPSDHFKGNQETKFGPQSYHSTFFDEEKTYKESVFKFVKDTFLAKSKTVLKDYKCAQANVFLKPAGAGFVFPHQNLSIVDEEQFTSLSFWVPLQDTDYDNGTICLIPGSQNHFMKFRNTHIEWPYIKFFKEGKGLDYFVPLKVKAGELLILDDRILHYSPINISQSDRWVLHSLWVPSEAQVLFYDLEKNEIKKVPVSDDFWQFHVPGTNLKGAAPSLKIQGSEKIYTEFELIKILENLKSQINILN